MGPFGEDGVPTMPPSDSRTVLMLHFSGDGSASVFYHEAVKRVWFCFSLPPETRAGLGASALLLAGSQEADEQAFELIQEEAVGGEPLAVYELGLLTIVGCGTAQDVETGLMLVETAAEDGLAEAQFTLGELFKTGELVEPDLAEALDWFQLAAEEDFPDSRERIDELMAAIETMRLGAEQGHADAQFRLGVMTWLGRAVLRNEAQGRAWIEAAAAQGHELALERLHYMDTVLPALRRQAAEGEPEAQFELARQFMLDEVLPQDIPEAISWLKRAARQGHAESCVFLGHATAWDQDGDLLDELRQAASDGEDWAIEALKHLPAGLGG